MAHSGRQRHRDREPGLRHFDTPEVPAANRCFLITDTERQQVAQSLRLIDDARRELEGQRNPENREIIRELRASADRIFELINALEETDARL